MEGQSDLFISAESRSSLYRGHRISVRATNSNEVEVRICTAKPGQVVHELHRSKVVASAQDLPKEEALQKGALERLTVRRAWEKGQRFVDKRLALREALRAVPEWEIPEHLRE